MNKTFFKNMVLAALMTLPVLAKAQTTFAGITAEKNAQNTPEGWTAVELPQLPAITSANTLNIKDYGASTSAADNTKAIQKALDAVPTTGGMVVIPAGTWMFGSTDQMTSKTEVLSIKSKTVLHLCAGAILKLVEYGKAPNNKTVFIGCKNKGKNVTDVVIEGEGETSIIDGQGARWWLAKEQSETFNPGAMIRFEQGKRFLLRNFKIQNTPGVNITMNGTTAGIRMKTGINSDGTLRGGGEEDWRFTNFIMTKVKNPLSIDCFYDKNYNSDPAVDKANARALDSTTPTYNGIYLQNVKTTDVCDGNAIFFVGRPESHIKNVTLDNVQISAKKGIDIRFVDNLVFKNGSKITVSSGAMWLKKFDSTYEDLCNATSTGTIETDPNGVYTLNSL